MNKALALKIKGLIEENNLSVQGLEKKAGLKINAVRNILTGHSKKPSAETLLAVAKALNCSISDLLGEVSQDQNISSNIEKVVFKNHDLLSEIAVYIISEFKKSKEVVAALDLINLTQEIYKYSSENNDNQLDQRFASWLLSKHLD